MNQYNALVKQILEKNNLKYDVDGDGDQDSDDYLEKRSRTIEAAIAKKDGEKSSCKECDKKECDCEKN